MAKKDERRQTKDDDQTLARVRELAWTGQHKPAIDSATQALSAPKTRPAEQMSLLDLRAESYIAIGKLDLAMKDAKAMGKIGQTSKVKGLQVQALNRLALVQTRTGDLKAAVKSAIAAVKTKHTSPALRAESLYRLAEAQLRAGQSEAGVETAQKAIALYQELGDLSGTGRAHWALSFGYFYSGNANDSRSAAFTALELCQQAGDQYGIGNAFNILSFSDTDLVENMQHVQQALQAFETAGYVERRAAASGNLSNVYSELGLHPHARRLTGEALDIQRRIGAKAGASVQLSNLTTTELTLGLDESAFSHLAELTQVVTALGDPVANSTLASTLAELALAQGDPKAALRHLKAALKIDHEFGTEKEIDNLAQLGLMHLANHDPAAALKATKKAVEMFRNGVFTTQGYFIWWRHTQALTANQKNKEASQAIEQAYALLLERIANVRDEGYRRNFLNKVEDNRTLLQFWAQDGAKRKLPKERLYAHLAVETNIREPFQRLAATGLRLNALKTVGEIQRFLVEEATELSGGERVMLILERSADFSRQNQAAKVAATREVVLSILPLPSYQSGKGYEKVEDPQDVLKRIHKYLDQAKTTRAVQLIKDERGKKAGAPNRKSSIENHQSRIIAPLIAQNQLLGYLYVDMDSLYGSFDATDRDMLGMLANQGAVALDNAGLLQGLERKVEERTAQLQEHISELQIINSIQQGLAAELDFQAIVDLVGDKLREVFNTPDLGIRWHDEKTDLIHYLYEYEHGERQIIPSMPPQPGGMFEAMVKTRQPLVVNTIADKEKMGIETLPGTDESKSIVSVPIISSDRVLGAIGMENYERENAFGESELRLLTTIAASLGTALENARLFDETQRLLKITEERNAELAIINSVQAALAAELNIQGIYDAVGDKVREIFNNKDLSIRIYDPKTKLLHIPYANQGNQRLEVDPLPIGDKGFSAHVLRTRETIVINENMLEAEKKYGAYTLPGTESEKSLVFVPLIAGDQVRGMINLLSMEEHAFSESDVRLLQTLANSMSVALENARLFDETQRLLKITEDRAAELAVINSIQQGLAAELDMQAIVEQTGEKLRKALRAEDLGIRLYDAQTGLMHYLYEYEHGRRLNTPPRPIIKGGTFEKIMKTRQPFVRNTLAERETLGLQLLPGTTASKSSVNAPIIGSDRVIGTIIVHDHEKEYAFSDAQVRLLQTVAASMGVSLENARLFDETQRLLKITEERNAELAILNNISEALTSTLDAKTLIYSVGDKIREIFNAEIVDILIYDPKSNMVNLTYSYYEQYFEDEPAWALEGGLTAQVILSRRPLQLNTAQEINEAGRMTPTKCNPISACRSWSVKK